MTSPGFNPDTIATGSQIGLNVGNASPPTDAYISQDDYLYIGFSTSLASGTLNVTARILMPDGKVIPNVWPIQMTFSRAVQTIRIPFPEGFLLSCAVLLATTAAPRTTYASLAISRSTLAPALLGNVLVQGYADTNVPLSWPNGILSTNLDVAGSIQKITVTVPAAGADWVQAVPANTRWRLVSVIAQLSTSVAVASRSPVFTITDGTTPVMKVNNLGAGVAAGQSSIFQWLEIGPYNNNQVVMVYLPPRVVLPAGWTVGAVTGSLQAGDQWSSIFLVIEEWLVP